MRQTLYKNPFLMPHGMSHDDVFIHEHEPLASSSIVSQITQKAV